VVGDAEHLVHRQALIVAYVGAGLLTAGLLTLGIGLIRREGPDDHTA